MNKVKNISEDFQKGLDTLGFDSNDDSLFLTTPKSQLSDPEIEFHIEKARDEFQASAVYLRKQLNGSYKPQAYLFDFTDRSFNHENQIPLTEIQKKVWSSGEAPLACIFYNTEIKILDCTTHIIDAYTPVHLIKHLALSENAHNIYNKQFAIKIKSGIFWEEEELKNKFKFQNSSYDKLIENIRHIVNSLKKEYQSVSIDLINKIIVQSILIKYLEERIDDNGNKLLSDKFFKKYDKSSTFNDVLRKTGKFVDLLDDLNDPKKGFNGNVFKWEDEEKKEIQKINLSILAELLESNSSLRTGQLSLWRYFEFKYIPVELISRLYEEFLGDDKKDKGMYYTPSHLTKLLIDESLPLKKYKTFDLGNYQILDPACGSGIFLVIAFKRLVQIWRLQNGMKSPELSDLKKILRNVYGIDKEEQAVRLASFSLCLALCNELNPIEIINKLKFDDLRENNLIQSDFFECKKIKNKKFDLIIGNPPFNRGAIKEYSHSWELEKQKVNIPQGQIALKFLSESLSYLKESGLLCLIIKSSGLLYNSSSDKYKKMLFSNFNVIQLLDFTALARNKSLWDNGADVASAAIFIRNEKPNFKNNILHLTFRRTKATKERIVFEIDDYDLHFVNRQTAIENSFIWKNNLLGGGRIKALIEKVQSFTSFNNYLEENNCSLEEGFEIGSKEKLHPDFIYKIPFLPTEAISENGIEYKQLEKIGRDVKFSKIPVEATFEAPNLIIWESLGEKKFPIFYNDISFSFKRRLISVKSRDNNVTLLNTILKSFKLNYSFYKFYLLATSGETLINRNNTFLLKDLKNIPFVENAVYSTFDVKIIQDSITFFTDFFIHGENSKAVKAIAQNEFYSLFVNYGNEFSNVLNLIYEDKKKRFRLSDVITLNNSFIATIFKYDSNFKEPTFHSDNSKLNLKELTDIEISKQLTVNRIIKLYPQKDTIVFIKPNQYRYWLSLAAYRDADKCFSDLSQLNN